MDDVGVHPIVILDFGSQYTQLIARRIRELGVYCEIHSHLLSESAFDALAPVGVVLSGGPATVTHHETPKVPAWIFDKGLPILGICYGMQALANQLGGQVEHSAKKEFGYATVRELKACPLLDGIEDGVDESGVAYLDVWMSHGDHVTQLPPGFCCVGQTSNTPIAMMMDKERQWYGLQFHPEVTHTKQGLRILRRFVVEICKANTNWNVQNIAKHMIDELKQRVQGEKVLLGLSGGVDSSVVAALLHKAIGQQLICIFVDTGLLRLHERDDVMAMFARHMGVNVVAVDARARFLDALKGVSCPEEKRKIIGHTFVEVFEEAAKPYKDVAWLAQGTIYPDVIESSHASEQGASAVIKSHHNVGGLPQDLNFKLLEPIRLLFKDEVRQLGLELGLPAMMLNRHPFPGPGLGVRILGEVSEVAADKLRLADAIFIEELRRANLYDRVSQAFAVLLPVKSVGVVGDGRCYEEVIALRAVETVDFMTAVWAHLPYDFLGHVSHRIINEVPHVSRVVYDISGKPPATIEWE